jgi:hypothetical protein
MKSIKEKSRATGRLLVECGKTTVHIGKFK